MKITVLYVGSSLLAPLKNAEQDLNRVCNFQLPVAPHNFGSPLSDSDWQRVEKDLSESQIVFVIHVMDGENAARLLNLLDRPTQKHRAVVVINCMPGLMRRTRRGRLDINALTQSDESGDANSRSRSVEAVKTLASAASWLCKKAPGQKTNRSSHGQSLKL